MVFMERWCCIFINSIELSFAGLCHMSRLLTCTMLVNSEQSLLSFLP